jgi:hypothetical protein
MVFSKTAPEMASKRIKKRSKYLLLQVLQMCFTFSTNRTVISSKLDLLEISNYRRHIFAGSALMG